MKVFCVALLMLLALQPLVWAQDSTTEPSSVEVSLSDDYGFGVVEEPSSAPAAPQAPAEPTPQVDTAASSAPASEPAAYPSAAPSNDLSAPSYSSGPSLAEARQYLESGDLDRSKAAIESYKQGASGAELDAANDLLAQVNFKMLADTTKAFAGTTEYTVRSGDSLYVIAKKHKTTPEFIARLNNVKNGMIRPGQKLRLVTSPLTLKVSKSKNRLELYLGGEILRTYLVSTGTNGSTPAGTFKITTKLVNPTWYKTGAVVPPDSKENILGTRWLGFSKEGLGIHGTTQPELIGTQASQGCVRMKNEEVEELYDLVPSGTEVIVEE